MNKKLSIGIIVIIAIVTLAVFGGCIEYEASPSSVVQEFAWQSKRGNFDECYKLMSEKYKSSVDESTFREEMKRCHPLIYYYEFDAIISENITGNSARVEFTYYKKSLIFWANIYPKPKRETKTVDLVKEDDGWKLSNVYCELNTQKEIWGGR